MVPLHSNKLIFKNIVGLKTSSDSEDCFVFLSKVFGWLGIKDSYGSKGKDASHFAKALRYFYPLLLHLADVDIAVMCICEIETIQGYGKEDIIFIFGSICGISSWHTMSAKRALFHSLLLRLQKVSRLKIPSHSCVRFLMFVVIIISSFSASLTTYASITSDKMEYCHFFYYHTVDECEPIPFNFIYFLGKAFLLRFISPLFCYVSSILFCTLCHRCSSLLISYRHKVEKIIASRTFYELNPGFYRNYSEIRGTICEVRNVFSLLSFLLFAANFIQAFYLLVCLLRVSDFSKAYFVDNIFGSMPAAVLCLLIPACAAQVAIERKRNKETFGRLHEELTFCCGAKSENKRVAKCLKQAEPIVLSAWDMIDFNSNIVPAVIGCFLTYGLLIMNIDQQ